MKCPKCGKNISSKVSCCKHCGTRFVRKSDKLAKKMTMDGRIAMACGGLLMFIGLVVFLNGGRLWAAIIFALGVLLTFIGKKMR
ncbi:MAG: hypothetical protein JEY79_14880 [Pseudodesulfovibrio sp.]|nr:hypothetical protein [Pseudodesulfovibrio sp.]